MKKFESEEKSNLSQKNNAGMKEVQIELASEQNLVSWMNMIDLVKDLFPGMETKQAVEDYKHTVLKFMNRKEAICALIGEQVVGTLLFSTQYSMLCFMAVHPDYRRNGIGRKMVELMLEYMGCDHDIVVQTYRADDKNGASARAFYQSLGFEEGELCMFDGKYPEQMFRLKSIHISR